MDTLFPLGKVLVTPGAFHAFKRSGEQLTPYLDRRGSGKGLGRGRGPRLAAPPKPKEEDEDFEEVFR
jgi:hypothetical protein